MGFWLSFTLQAGLYHVFVTCLNPQRSASSHCNGSSMILKLQFEFLLFFSFHCIMAAVWRSFCVAPLDSTPSLLESAAYPDGRNSRCKEIKGST